MNQTARGPPQVAYPAGRFGRQLRFAYPSECLTLFAGGRSERTRGKDDVRVLPRMETQGGIIVFGGYVPVRGRVG